MVFFMETNKFSKIITQDDSLPAAQAMLYGIGLNEKDMGKAHASLFSFSSLAYHLIESYTIPS